MAIFGLVWVAETLLFTLELAGWVSEGCGMRSAARYIAINPTEPSFFEGWGTGTFFVNGVFPMDVEPGDDLTYEDIQTKAIDLLDQTRAQKKVFWPWFLCSAYVFPVYYSPTGFSEELLGHMRLHSQHWKYGSYLDPILIDGGANKVWLRDAFENRRFLMWRHTINVVLSATLSVAKHRGLSGELSINDDTIKVKVPEENAKPTR